MSKRTGRPKEEGGHRTVKISVNKRVFNILIVPENRSKYAEYCVDTCTETNWIAFHDSSVTMNNNCRTYKTATTNIWVPNNSSCNGMVSILCTFEYRCTGRTFIFRMRINGNATTSIEVSGKTTWSLSQVYTESSFNDGIKVQANQDRYIIEFQFEPYGASDQACVKDITMFLDVIDGLRQ